MPITAERVERTINLRGGLSINYQKGLGVCSSPTTWLNGLLKDAESINDLIRFVVGDMIIYGYRHDRGQFPPKW